MKPFLNQCWPRSSSPSAAYMRRRTGSALVQIMACRLFGVNQCWLIVNWTLRNKFQWNFNQIANTFIEENAFENVVCKSSRGRCVKSWNVLYLVRPAPRHYHSSLSVFKPLKKDSEFQMMVQKMFVCEYNFDILFWQASSGPPDQTLNDRADSWLAPSQWENAISHWLGAKWHLSLAECKPRISLELVKRRAIIQRGYINSRNM